MLKQMVWFVRHLFQYLSLLIAISCHLTHDKEQTAITFPSYILFRDDGSNQVTKLQDISNSLQNIYNPEVIFWLVIFYHDSLTNIFWLSHL